MPIKMDGLTFSVILSFLFTAENIKIFNDYPQKVGSDSEPSRRCLQPSRGAERDFLWKRSDDGAAKNRSNMGGMAAAV